MRNNPLKPHWVNGNLEEAITILANTAITAREKRSIALVKNAGGWQDTLNSAKDSVMENVVNPAGDAVRQYAVEPTLQSIGAPGAISQTMKHLGWGAAGALGGGILGAGSQLFEPKRKRRYLAGALTGGLIGGGGGIGASLLHSNMGQVKDIIHKSPEELAEENKQYQANLGKNFEASGTGSPELAAVGNKYGVDPGSLSSLARRVRDYGDAPINEYLSDAKKRQLAFARPPDANPEEFRGLKNVPEAALSSSGFKPKEIEDIGGPDNLVNRNAFMTKILQSYKDPKVPSPYMRTMVGADGKSVSQPYTQADLDKLDWKDLHNKATTNKEYYPYDQGEANADRIKFQLKRMVGEADKAGPTGEIARKANGLFNAPGRLAHGHIEDLHSGDNKGIWDTLERFSSGVKIDENSQGYKDALTLTGAKQFTPTEIMEAYKQGDRGIANLARLAEKQQRKYTIPVDPDNPDSGTNEVKYNAGSASEAITNLIPQVRKQLGDDRGWTSTLNKYGPTTTSNPGDVMLPIVATDAVGTAWDVFLSSKGRNPRDILHAIKEGKLPANVASNAELVKYLNHAASKGTEGIKNIMKNPNYYMGAKDLQTKIEALRGTGVVATPPNLQTRLGLGAATPPEQLYQMEQELKNMYNPTSIHSGDVTGAFNTAQSSLTAANAQTVANRPPSIDKLEEMIRDAKNPRVSGSTTIPRNPGPPNLQALGLKTPEELKALEEQLLAVRKLPPNQQAAAFSALFEGGVNVPGSIASRQNLENFLYSARRGPAAEALGIPSHALDALEQRLGHIASLPTGEAQTIAFNNLLNEGMHVPPQLISPTSLKRTKAFDLSGKNIEALSHGGTPIRASKIEGSRLATLGRDATPVPLGPMDEINHLRDLIEKDVVKFKEPLAREAFLNLPANELKAFVDKAKLNPTMSHVLPGTNIHIDPETMKQISYAGKGRGFKGLGRFRAPIAGGTIKAVENLPRIATYGIPFVLQDLILRKGLPPLDQMDAAASPTNEGK